MKCIELIKFKNKIKFDDLVIYFNGLVFYDKFECGKKSILEFFKNNKNKYMDNLDELSGNFVLKVIDKRNEYIFTDNSGMSRIYYDSDCYSDSFLDIIKYKKYDIKDIDYFGLVEMLQFGANIFHTFIKDVSLLDRDKYLVISNNKIKIKTKKIFGLEHKNYDIEKFYKNLKYNLNGMKIAADLTAGTDSRLNCALLNGNGIKFKTTISGEEDCIDFRFCKKLSSLFGIEKYNFDYNIKIDNEVFDEIFFNLDGQYSVLDVYKNYLLNKNLSKDQFDIRINGAGGELYKYSWFAQDFPFMHKKNFNLNKLYSKRFVTSSLDKKHSKKFQETIQLYQKELIKRLELYKKENNSKTYDNICYEVWMRHISSAIIVNKNLSLVWYSPLLELKCVRAGYNMGIFGRLNYMLHRKLITKYSKTVSKHKTNKGLTVNSNFFYIFVDNIKLFKEFLEKILNKVFHKKKVVIDTATSKKVFSDFFEYDDELVNILYELNILDRNYYLDKGDTIYYSNLMTIARFIKYLKDYK